MGTADNYVESEGIERVLCRASDFISS